MRVKSRWIHSRQAKKKGYLEEKYGKYANKAQELRKNSWLAFKYDLATELKKPVEEIELLTRDELDYWYARSLMIPFGWKRDEYTTARLLSALTGGGRIKDSFINYLEEQPEDDQEFLDMVAQTLKG